MKLLIDECLPRALKRLFGEHACRTVQEMGWAVKKNGLLPSLAETEFNLLVTMDYGFEHQHSSLDTGWDACSSDAPLSRRPAIAGNHNRRSGAPELTRPHATSNVPFRPREGYTGKLAWKSTTVPGRVKSFFGERKRVKIDKL
jgi:hypothetical protein